jgi:hypothetical protein
MDESSSIPSPLSQRARQAAKIVGHPERYKICEGCDSIVAERVVTCPNCFGYRFNGERRAVIDQARLLGSREQTSVVAEDLL